MGDPSPEKYISLNLAAPNTGARFYKVRVDHSCACEVLSVVHTHDPESLHTDDDFLASLP